MENFKRNIGYTIDQTILIVAIIAILVTLIIATVGWNIITRTGGTKLAAQMRQVEDAVGQFYAAHQVWPHQAITQGNQWAIQPRVLANLGTGYTLSGNIDADKMRNMIAGFESDGTNIFHGFGSGGQIFVVANAAPTAANIGSNIYVGVQMSNVPINEVQEADEIIDGSLSSTEGRLVYRADGQCLTNNTFRAAPGGSAVAANVREVNVCYFANLVQ